MIKTICLKFRYSGNGPLIEFATLREYMNSNVKKVLWIYFEDNDLSGLHNEMSDKILRNIIMMQFKTKSQI